MFDRSNYAKRSQWFSRLEYVRQIVRWNIHVGGQESFDCLIHQPDHWPTNLETNISVSRFGCVHNCCWNSARLSSKNCCCAECNRCQRRMEPMSMERNVTTTYEYSNAFPFEKAFDQWHYKRWTEDNWVRILLKKGMCLTSSWRPFGHFDFIFHALRVSMTNTPMGYYPMSKSSPCIHDVCISCITDSCIYDGGSPERHIAAAEG